MSSLATVSDQGTTPGVFSRPEEPAGLSWKWQCALFVLVCGAIFSRCPELFLHARFYAEDGRFWYAQAYNLGWLTSLTLPVAGYLNTLQRLAAGLALLVSFQYAPLVMNLCGLLIQVVPVLVLLSSRCRNWGSLSLRLVMATIYVVMPNTAEIHVVVTNSQWHFVMLEFFLAFGVAPHGRPARICEAFLFTLGGFCGPFSIMLAPLLLVYWWLRRERWTLVVAGLLSIGLLTQLWLILHSTRVNPGPLGATPVLFIRLAGGNIFLGSMTALRLLLFKVPTGLLCGMVVFGMAVLAFGLRYGSLPVKLFLVFAELSLVPALHNPLITGPKPSWQLLVPDFICRYWYYPALAFLWSATLCVFQKELRTVRAVGCCVLISMLGAGIRDWRYHLVEPPHFEVYVQQLRDMPPGSHIVIPVYPPPWTMELVKH